MTDTKQNLKNAMFLIERLIEEELNFIQENIGEDFGMESIPMDKHKLYDELCEEHGYGKDVVLCWYANVDKEYSKELKDFSSLFYEYYEFQKGCGEINYDLLPPKKKKKFVVKK